MQGTLWANEEVYNELLTWVDEHNYKISVPIREVYISDPKVVNREEILMEIYAPDSFTFLNNLL